MPQREWRTGVLSSPSPSANLVGRPGADAGSYLKGHTRHALGAGLRPRRSLDEEPRCLLTFWGRSMSALSVVFAVGELSSDPRFLPAAIVGGVVAFFILAIVVAWLTTRYIP